MAKQGKGELHKINWSGQSYLAYPNYSICYLLGIMQTITSQYDARCKQLYGWHINIIHIFLISKTLIKVQNRLENSKGLNGLEQINWDSWRLWLSNWTEPGAENAPDVHLLTVKRDFGFGV
jgi:hypothetical protein